MQALTHGRTEPGKRKASSKNQQLLFRMMSILGLAASAFMLGCGADVDDLNLSDENRARLQQSIDSTKEYIGSHTPSSDQYRRLSNNLKRTTADISSGRITANYGVSCILSEYVSRDTLASIRRVMDEIENEQRGFLEASGRAYSAPGAGSIMTDCL